MARRRLAAIGAGAAVSAGAALLAQHTYARQPQCSAIPAPLEVKKRSSQNFGTQLVLSGDCGGTNTRLVLYRVKLGTRVSQGHIPDGETVYAKKYPNSEHESFVDVCKLFLKEAGGKTPTTCCLAVAGAISNNSVDFTNVKHRGWSIDGNMLERELGISRVRLINDFVAQGYGLLTLGPDEVVKLNNGVERPGLPIACIGAGTGLGQCYLTAGHDGHYICHPSEGGHAELAPRDELTKDFYTWLKAKYSLLYQADPRRPHRVSVERAVSGEGLVNIYSFLREHWGFHGEEGDVDKAFLAAPADKKAGVIAKGAGLGDAICTKAVQVFSEMYGSEAGVAALKWLPYGGLYISGGIAAKNPSWVQSQEFLDAYKDKGRLSPLVEQVPLYLVLTEDTGERGALYMAVHLLSRVEQ